MEHINTFAELGSVENNVSTQKFKIKLLPRCFLPRNSTLNFFRDVFRCQQCQQLYPKHFEIPKQPQDLKPLDLEIAPLAHHLRPIFGLVSSSLGYPENAFTKHIKGKANPNNIFEIISSNAKCQGYPKQFIKIPKMCYFLLSAILCHHCIVFGIVALSFIFVSF